MIMVMMRCNANGMEESKRVAEISPPLQLLNDTSYPGGFSKALEKVFL